TGTTAKIEVLREAHEKAKVTGNAEIVVNCFGIKCTYNGTGLVGEAKGPLLSTEANGEVNLSEQVVSGGGTFCPPEGKLDIKTTPLAAGYIAKPGALHYCVEYPTNAVGLYTNSTCTTLTASPPTHTGKFELVIAQGGLAVGGAVCVHLILLKGLYKDSVCT